MPNIFLLHNAIAYLGVCEMSDLNRGIMKFKGADKPVVVAVSAVLILSSIIALIVWALSSAYAI
ncbi:conserved hypothetical protein [Hyella patelloides LEGE 07179]|uniref:Uncharacterized protein n=1 Tax=Hyella patelloides LEGE 07179 TaxID=945734 RepID=A0A563VJN1_9CYAN|nr:hypothetical protein [Hyella patelloides]VEP11676.1 conserved hypothetical protein [Hyella patelloides LEGE 07179]